MIKRIAQKAVAALYRPEAARYDDLLALMHIERFPLHAVVRALRDDGMAVPDNEIVLATRCLNLSLLILDMRENKDAVFDDHIPNKTEEDVIGCVAGLAKADFASLLCVQKLIQLLQEPAYMKALLHHTES